MTIYDDFLYNLYIYLWLQHGYLTNMVCVNSEDQCTFSILAVWSGRVFTNHCHYDNLVLKTEGPELTGWMVGKCTK